MAAVALRSKVLSAILYIKVCNTLRFGNEVEQVASVQFDGGKLHGATEAKAMMRHADMQERLEACF